MLKVGITGGIGSGKSTVARIFSHLGIPVYDSDQRAKDLVSSDTQLITQIKQLMGVEAYLPDGTYHRKYISEQVFKNPEKLKALNHLIHPAVRKDFEAWVNQQVDAPYVLKEAAIMNRDSGLDAIIVVHTPVKERIERVIKRDGRTEDQVKNIMENQKTEEEFISVADYVINNGNGHSILRQVLEIDKKLRSTLDQYNV
ncbi:dephospho-CoA kinase [Leadbetterella byssophila DSM 17132]|uniref:Dephospho-CoA kinase n=1 Tax=Leadbetterella byssophila (strain DSM 17132 / JCM 16389 / KACC 11308 / NBRC 106382 / 4M15) TaxID=649349 RepID=E4RRJ1_LEAB4|nr:dephospho-CoA kinase [Leadbetterella byssophila]ADQ15820.1 dephospho-CoA kinase [Leadbetterella byssophila DSM 17132]